MTKQQLLEMWTEVRFELLTLTPLFKTSPEGLTALESFEEYLSHNELGLALERLCDFLIGSEVSVISPEQLAQIQSLHSRMSMDSCVEKLRRRSVL